MTALRLWFRAELRRRWKSWAALILLVGLAGGVVIGALAGDAAHGHRLRPVPRGDRACGRRRPAVPFPLDVAAISALPELEAAINTPYMFLGPAEGERRPELSPVVMSTEGEASKVLAGRRADPNRADEATVNAVASRMGDIDVGDVLRFHAYSPDGARAILEGERRPADGPEFSVRIVGIEVMPGALLPSEEDEGLLILTPAWGRTYGAQTGSVDLLDVKLRRGEADLPAFKTAVERIAGDHPVYFQNAADDTAQAQRSIHVQAVALRLFAALAAVAALLVIGQALARQSFVEADDQRTLAALGLERPQRFLGAMLRPALIAAAGSLLAGVVAVLGSPLLPFGLARDAEPDPGMAFHAGIVIPGVAGLFLLILLVAAYPTWRATRVFSDVPVTAAAAAGRPSALAAFVARLGLRPTAVTGVRMATEPGRGRSSVPTRAALAGTSLSVLALVTAFTYGHSFQRLLDTPRLYGWNWDALVGDFFFEDLSELVEPVLRESDAIAGYSAITVAEADVEGVRTPAFGFDTVQGSVFPPIVAGHAPRGPGEIVLGAKTLDEIGKNVGESVTLRIGERSSRVRIVGRAVLPSLGGGDVSGLGEGALLTGHGLGALVPDAPRTLFAVRFTPGTSAAEAEEALVSLAEDVGFEENSLPTRIADFGRVDGLPMALATLLGIIAIAMLVHTLVSAVRRRRRDLAILKTLGFVRGQVRGTVAWQATTLALFALVVGIPLGVAAGRWSWRIFADELGIVPEPVVPVVTVLLLVAAAIALANGAATVPARVAARTQPALLLRAE